MLRIRDLEVDQDLLKSKEDEVVATVKNLEEDQKLLDKKEREIIRSLDKLNKTELNIKNEAILLMKASSETELNSLPPISNPFSGTIPLKNNGNIRTATVV